MYDFAKKNFVKYIKSHFDLNDDKIQHKLNHTLCVVANAWRLCTKLKMSQTNREIALIIALLHDIGRFTEAQTIQSFREDLYTCDHAEIGVRQLFEEQLIRLFVQTDQYDEIIKTAILNHNKYEVNFDKMTNKESLFTKIIRDADKLDSFRAKCEEGIFTMSNITYQDVENSFVSQDVYNDFMNEKMILSIKRKTALDVWVSYIAFIYGLYFKESRQYVSQHRFVDKLIDRFSYKRPEIKRQMEYIRIKGNTFIAKF